MQRSGRSPVLRPLVQMPLLTAKVDFCNRSMPVNETIVNTLHGAEYFLRHLATYSFVMNVLYYRLYYNTRPVSTEFRILSSKRHPEDAHQPSDLLNVWVFRMQHDQGLRRSH